MQARMFYAGIMAPRLRTRTERDTGTEWHWEPVCQYNKGDAYQGGIDGQLLVWIDQQKYMSDVSL